MRIPLSAAVVGAALAFATPAAAAEPLTIDAARAAIVEKAKGDLHRYPDYYRVEGGKCWRLSDRPAVACDVTTFFGDDTACVEQMVAHRDPAAGTIEVDSLVGGVSCRSV